MKRVRHLALLLLALYSISVSGQGVEKVKDSKATPSSIIDLIRQEPGVTINGNADEGKMPSISIRGIGTNSEYHQPLFIVDGVRMEDILYVQPENVYSITVIKDGTTSLYGMEGANGVIEIKTKGAVEAQKQEAQNKKEFRKKMRKERKERKKKKEKPE